MMSMQSSTSESRLLTLRVVSMIREPFGVECESVGLTAIDTDAGKGGGAYDVHYGHADTVLAIKSGTVTARRNGAVCLSFRCNGGFARVTGGNTVTVVTETVETVE